MAAERRNSVKKAIRLPKLATVPAPPRMGRKGDPRMHRAVSARLKDPSLTLFDALQVGGFDYPADEDAGCFDSERVTLGQRKNQLSRRIRLAKKQLQDGTSNNNNGNDCESGKGGSDSSSETKAGTKRRSLSPPSSSLSDVESEEDAHVDSKDYTQELLAKYHPQFQQLKILRANGGQKIAASSAMGNHNIMSSGDANGSSATDLSAMDSNRLTQLQIGRAHV